MAASAPPSPPAVRATTLLVSVCVQALAKECDACFINLKASTILSKWYGDTNKLISAVWSLAYKLQPCILFIGTVVGGWVGAAPV